MDDEQREYAEKTVRDATFRSIHDSDFKAFQKLVIQSPIVYDVGGNRGQSIASFMAVLRSPTIHSFELNPYLHPVLTAVAAALPSVHVYPFGLSDEELECTFLVPLVHGKLRLEEASLDLGALEKPWVVERLTQADPDYKFVRQSGLVRIGDRLQLPPPDIIKIDVEGAEARVLRGLANTVARANPIILAENSDYGAVTELLQTYGYRPYRYNDGHLVPFFGQTTNTFYVRDGYERGLSVQRVS